MTIAKQALRLRAEVDARVSALHAAGAIPDPYWGRNEYDLRWIAEVDWIASRRFDHAGGPCDLVIDGLDTVADEKSVRAKTGFIFQNPGNQIILPIIRDDIALGPKSRGLDAAEVERLSPLRVAIVDPGATRTEMRARAYPGEDPMTVKPPEVVADRLVALLIEGFDGLHRERIEPA